MTRKEAIKILEDIKGVYLLQAGGFQMALDMAIKALNIGEVAPVIHAKWNECDDGWGGVYYDCSYCGESWTTLDGTPLENGMNYCPHCGAKMDKENKE